MITCFVCLTGKLSYDQIGGCFKLQDCEVACDVVHRLLDDLTTANTFLLDIICVCDKVWVYSNYIEINSGDLDTELVLYLNCQ